MAKSLKLYGNIIEGSIEFLSPEWAAIQLSALPDAQYTFLIEKYFGQRSSNQNRYLHGIVIPLVLEGLRDTGHNEVKDVHDAKKVIKSLFLKRKVVNENTGEVITEIVKDTHDLSTKEMSDFIDQVVQWAAEYLSITIPAPNQQLTIV